MTILFAEKIRYKPNLNELQSQCELNYYLLIKLWPCLINVNNQKIAKTLGVSSNARQLSAQTEIIHLTLLITDVARYTTTMDLAITSPQLKFSQGFNLIIRLYHDVKMLEVMEGSGPSALKAIYNFNKNNLKPVDEKRQINRFLGECLRAVLK